MFDEPVSCTSVSAIYSSWVLL